MTDFSRLSAEKIFILVSVTGILSNLSIATENLVDLKCFSGFSNMFLALTLACLQCVISNAIGPERSIFAQNSMSKLSFC